MKIYFVVQTQPGSFQEKRIVGRLLKVLSVSLWYFLTVVSYDIVPQLAEDFTLYVVQHALHRVPYLLRKFCTIELHHSATHNQKKYILEYYSSSM